jgi:D-threonate/D-erythronate kinase
MEGSDFRVIVIADDLTGANDTGVQIAKRGFTTVTAVDLGLAADTTADAIVLDTESRTLPAESARAVVREAARALGNCRGALVYKKIDSTLRGNIGAELDELVRELEPERVVCTPAYPKNGRTTRNGIHFLNGVPIDRTEMAADPRNPLDTSSVTAVLAKDGGRRFRHVELGSLRAGWAGFPADERFLSFDCEEQEDLRRIVRAVGETGKRVLWCGSAGLAEVLVEECLPAGKEREPGIDPQSPGAAASSKASCGPVLSVVGSVSGVSRRQLDKAVALGGVHVVRLHLPSLLDAPDRERARLVDELARQSAQAGHLVLTALETQVVPPAAGEPAAPPARDAFAERIACCFAEVTAEFVRKNRIAGMFLTGGDTAVHVIRAVGARGLQLEAELETAVPATRLIGGILHGLPVVTKAGAFGDERTLVRSAGYLAMRARSVA